MSEVEVVEVVEQAESPKQELSEGKLLSPIMRKQVASQTQLGPQHHCNLGGVLASNFKEIQQSLLDE